MLHTLSLWLILVLSANDQYTLVRISDFSVARQRSIIKLTSTSDLSVSPLEKHAFLLLLLYETPFFMSIAKFSVSRINARTKNQQIFIVFLDNFARIFVLFSRNKVIKNQISGDNIISS